MQNAVDNTLSIIKNHIIMVSKNGYTILVQKLGSYHITFVGHRGIVNFTIQLYTEFDFWTIEVKNKFSYTMLPSEL